MKSNFYSLLAVLILGVSGSVHAVDVLDKYPACDYTSLGNIEIQRTYDSRRLGDLNEIFKAKRESLLEELQDQASEKGATAILLQEKLLQLVDRHNEKSRRFKQDSRVTLVAEAIIGCEPEPGRTAKLAPLDQYGTQQKELNIGQVGGWEKSITFDLPATRSLTTEALSTGMVSLQQGAFGVNLGDTREQVFKTLGSPTALVQFADGVLANYGRKLFLLFDNEQLVLVTNQNLWLSQTLVNYIPFDDGIDESQWIISDSLSLGTGIGKGALEGFTRQADSLVTENNNRALHLFTENQQGMDVLTGFALYRKGYLSKPLTILPTNYQFYNDFTAYVNLPEPLGMETSMLSAGEMGRIRLNSTDTLLIMNQHTLVEESGGMIAKVSIHETLFKEHLQTASKKWVFGQLKAGQSKDQVLANLSDDVFEMYGQVEVTHDNYVQTLYFSESGDHEQLVSTEIAVF